MKNKTTWIIIIIALITLLTRFIGLNWSPPNLSNDEISIAYDAYSVAHTLRDEHNHFLPLSFQSNGTYKAPLTIYLTIPTTILFGNNEYGARLPSAILGSLTVLFLGFLVYELSTNRILALTSSAILATNPWHIYSSRMIQETNIALFLVTLGLYLFFYGLNRNKPVFSFFSYVSFALSLYAYHTEWGFTPLLILILWFFYKKNLYKKPSSYIGPLIFGLLLMPLFLDFLHNLGTNARANTELFFKDPEVARQIADQSLNLFQKTQVCINYILANYSNYINPSFYFFNGLNLLPSDDPYQVGLFLSPLIIAFGVGLFNIKKYFGDNSKFIYSWAFISPFIPALTIGGVSNYRHLVSLAPFTIIAAVGCLIIWKSIKNSNLLKGVALSSLLISFFYFTVIYFYHFPVENGVNFQYGYKQIATFIKPHYNEYSKIIIDPRFGPHNLYSGLPHLYIPYFTNLDPKALLSRHDSLNGVSFAKYDIRQIDWTSEKIVAGVLYVVPVSNMPESGLGLKKVLQIYLPNSQPAFALYSY